LRVLAFSPRLYIIANAKKPDLVSRGRSDGLIRPYRKRRVLNGSTFAERKAMVVRENWRGVLWVGNAIAMRTVAATLVMPIFTLYGLALTPSRFLVGLATGVFGIVQAFLEIPLGLLSDRVGRKRVLLFGNLFFLAGAVLSALAPNIGVLIVARMLQGAGATGSALLSYVADSIPKEERGRALGLINTLFCLSFLVGVIAGPGLAGWVGFSGLFWIGAILTVPASGLILMAGAEPRASRRALSGKSFRRLLVLRPLLGVNVAALLANYGIAAMFFLLPLVLTPYLAVGSFWRFILPMVLTGIVALTLLSRWMDRGRRKEVSVFAAISLFLGSLLPLTKSYPLLLAGYSLFFLGFAVELTLLGSMMTLLVPEESAGAKSGLFSVFQSLGIFLGGVITGLVIGWDAAWGFLFVSVAALALGIVHWSLFGLFGKSH
jgi:MFS family permease